MGVDQNFPDIPCKFFYRLCCRCDCREQQLFKAPSYVCKSRASLRAGTSQIMLEVQIILEENLNGFLPAFYVFCLELGGGEYLQYFAAHVSDL